MTRYCASLTLATVALTMAAAFSSAAADNFSPAKLYDGKTPDLRGIWQVKDTAYLNVEGHPAMNGAPASKSIIVDPADGKIPYTSEALAHRNENFKNRATADPALKCYESGVPRSTYLPKPLQIVQNPSNFAIVYQDNHSFRIVYPESKPHFQGIDWWMGDSRGKWEGNTYVVDVTTLNNEQWIDAAGNHLTSDTHIIERYTMTGPDTMQYEARIEDPKVYTKPWTIRTTLYRHKEPGFMLKEDECLDDENGVRHPMSPTDPRNLLKNDYSRWKTTAAK